MSDYWRECIISAADECGLVMSQDQISSMADAVKIAHENHGLFSGETPPTDYNWQERTVHELKKEHKKDIDALNEERRLYELDAEKAVKRYAKIRDDTDVTIVKGGYIEYRR